MQKILFCVAVEGGEYEIFETWFDAMRYAEKLTVPYYVDLCEVKHAYKMEDGALNYDDYSDTFRFITTIVSHV